MSRYRAWVFTLNNYKEEDCDRLQGITDKVKYLIFGKEIGEIKKTPHLQGYVVWNNAKNMAACKKSLGSNTIHLEIARGTSKQSQKYCSKEGDFFEFGEPPSQGKRVDLDNIMVASKEIKDLRKLILTYSEQGQVLTYQQLQVGEIYCDIYKEEEARDELVEDFKNAELRGWQIRALEKLDEQNDRQILWYVDSEGNHGKTFLAKYLVSRGNCFLVRNGKTADISFSYNYEDIVAFDFVRQKEDTINYGVIEAFKDGYLFSPKYKSKSKTFRSKKVIIFSNFYPDRSKLSSDRWQIIRL